MTLIFLKLNKISKNKNENLKMDEEKNKSSLTGFGDLIDDVTMTSSPDDENDEIEKPGRFERFQVNREF